MESDNLVATFDPRPDKIFAIHESRTLEYNPELQIQHVLFWYTSHVCPTIMQDSFCRRANPGCLCVAQLGTASNKAFHIALSHLMLFVSC